MSGAPELSRDTEAFAVWVRDSGALTRDAVSPRELTKLVLAKTWRNPESFSIVASILCEKSDKAILGKVVYKRDGLVWIWHFDFQHFDVMQDLFRLLLSLPEIVKKAIENQLRKNTDADDDDLMKLIRDLANIHLALTKLNKTEVDKVETIIFLYNLRHYRSSSHSRFDFGQSLVEFLAKLVHFKKSLAENELLNIFKTAKNLFAVADHVWLCCLVCLELFQPVWLALNRNDGSVFMSRQQKLMEIFRPIWLVWNRSVDPEIASRQQILLEKLKTDDGCKIIKMFVGLWRT